MTQTVIQLAQVPIFALHLGLGNYGVWLMLFAIPSYLAMADLGLASTAGNEMTASVARGQKEEALATFQAVRLTVALMSTALIFCALVLVYFVVPGVTDGIQVATNGHGKLTSVLVVSYGALALQNSVLNAGFRCSGGYAVSGYIGAALLAAESIGGVGVVLAGGGVFGAALCYVGIRAVGTVLFNVVLAYRAPWLMSLRWKSSSAVLLRLVRPAIAVMIMPLAQAGSIQGTVLIIGMAAGSAAIPGFTAVRTLSRLSLQAILIINHAIMPEFTIASARGDNEEVTRLTSLSVFTSFLLAPGAALVLSVGGVYIVRLWTHGVVQPAQSLVMIMALTMVLNSLWQPLSNLILSVNRHESFTWFYLLISCISLVICFLLTSLAGSSGAATSVFLTDAVMLTYIGYLWNKMEFAKFGDIVALVRLALTHKGEGLLSRGSRRQF